MNWETERIRLIAISDLQRYSEQQHVEAWAELLEHIAPERIAFQLRGPDCTTRSLWELGSRFRKRFGNNAQLIVNDRLELAQALGAQGVHLGRKSISLKDARRWLSSDVWFTSSAHSLEDVRQACLQRFSMILLSPVFPSPGKPPPLGLEALVQANAICQKSSTLVALGGIDFSTWQTCLEKGVKSVAMIRSMWEQTARQAWLHSTWFHQIDKPSTSQRV
jgi:thiamine-phosphate pyrophosphorylase